MGSWEGDCFVIVFGSSLIFYFVEHLKYGITVYVMLPCLIHGCKFSFSDCFSERIWPMMPTCCLKWIMTNMFPSGLLQILIK
jgi:hypothetical protein